LGWGGRAFFFAGLNGVMTVSAKLRSGFGKSDNGLGGFLL
jgi:hypothetical protein